MDKDMLPSGPIRRDLLRQAVSEEELSGYSFAFTMDDGSEATGRYQLREGVGIFTYVDEDGDLQEINADEVQWIYWPPFDMPSLQQVH